MSAYTAYQLAQPQQSLLDSMTTRGFGPAVDTTLKKKNIIEDAQEKVERAFKKSEKRSEKWKPVTTILDTAQSFVDPATAAILGAVSGGLSGFDRYRAYDKLKDDTKGIGEYNFMDEYMKNIDKKVRGLETDSGDVLVSAGTGALKGFITSSLGQIGKGGGGGGAEDAAAEVLEEGAQQVTDTATQEVTKKVTEEAAKDVTDQAIQKGFEEGTQKLAQEGLEKGAEQFALKANPTDVLGETTLDFSAADKLGDFDVGKIKEATTKVGGYKPEWADWIKEVQKGKGKDFLSSLIDPDDIAGSLARITQMGQGFLEPLMAYNKPSDFRLY